MEEVRSYDDFKNQPTEKQNEILVDILNRYAERTFKADWNAVHAEIILGLHEEKKLKATLHQKNPEFLKHKQLRRVSDFGRKVIDPKILLFIDDLSNSDANFSITLNFLKQKFPPKKQETKEAKSDPAPSAAASATSSADSAGAKWEKVLLDTPSGSAPATSSTKPIITTMDQIFRPVSGSDIEDDEYKPLTLVREGDNVDQLMPPPPPGKEDLSQQLLEDCEGDKKLYFKIRAYRFLNDSKHFLWTNRNPGQITGGGLILGGGLIGAFGIFAGKNAVVSAGMTKILPGLFAAWSISHGVPPAAMFFYLLGALLAVAGLITLGASTIYQKYKRSHVTPV